MKTTRIISTISFNTPEFLLLKLEELKKNKIISFFAFVPHLPEDDEGGRKEHIHLLIEPARSIFSEDLTEALIEFDPKMPDKPRKPIAWHFSKFDDWYLYSIHDKGYLALKNEQRKYSYGYTDVITSDTDDLNYRVRTIDLTNVSPYAAIKDAIEQGLTMEEFFKRGTVALPQVANFQRAWDLLSSKPKTERNGRKNHPMDTAAVIHRDCDLDDIDI